MIFVNIIYKTCVTMMRHFQDYVSLSGVMWYAMMWHNIYHVGHESLKVKQQFLFFILSKTNSWNSSRIDLLVYLVWVWLCMRQKTF